MKTVLKESKGTAFYVTHDQTEAMAMSDRVAVMHEGRLWQVGPPDELYHRPANTFVAGFVGSPPMNLVEGEAVADNGLWFRAGDFRMKIPQGTGSGAAVKKLGIRPEHIAFSGGSEVQGVVEDVEPLGSEHIVTVNCGVPLLVRQVQGRVPSPGQTVGLAIDPDKVHLFDGEGKRVEDR